MIKKFRAHLSRNAVLYVLLFVMLGGTAYAGNGGKVKAGDLGNVKVRYSDATVANGGVVTHTTTCNKGERALSGSMKWDGNQNAGNVSLVQQNLQPVKNPTQVTATGRVISGGARTMKVGAVCLVK